MKLPKALVANKNNEHVITVIYRKIKFDKVDAFLEWQNRVTVASQAFDGYIKTSLIEPSISCKEEDEREYIIIFKFENRKYLSLWQESTIRKELLEEASMISIDTPVLKTYYSLEHWFDEQYQKTSRLKMTVVSFFAISPLVHFIPPFMNKHLIFSSFLNETITTALITICMSYIALPVMVRLFKPWLK